jgi:AcrR family transcriptional regulator
MAHAVAADGYHATTVRHVVRTARVSRRSFYEHYANREACFLATFDALGAHALGSLRGALLQAGPDTGRGCEMALAALAGGWSADPDGVAVLAREAQHAGRAAVVRLRLLTARCGRVLADGAGPDRAVLAQALAGGVLGGISRHARECEPPSDLMDDLRRWSEVLQTGRRPAAPDTAKLPRIDSANCRQQQDRLLDVALRLALRPDFPRLTTPELADAAGFRVDAILERFAHPQDCYLAALDGVAERAHASLATAVPGEVEGSTRAMLSLQALLAHLGERRLDAHTLGYAAFAAGPASAERASELARGLAARVTAGDTPSFETDALAGALVHLVGCLALRDRTERLPALGRHLWPIVRSVSDDV